MKVREYGWDTQMMAYTFQQQKDNVHTLSCVIQNIIYCIEIPKIFNILQFPETC